ncbi:hypothetical protein BIW11_06661 [Tropilaelaps mercedesae]|uniref:Single domain-containing protein n=1 Tax=Tropilaelaps mercedesae TaxID=418985 RepID=A0A1V9XXB3_9ACAR|nr:hypothetical protein BIW11_06661 [Tropilaelaps mercedesae]
MRIWTMGSCKLDDMILALLSLLLAYAVSLLTAVLLAPAIFTVVSGQSNNVKPLSYKYYPNVIVKMNECIDPVYAVSFTGDYYPNGVCERHRCFINAGKQGHVEVTRCPPPQVRGCWPLSNETQPYPRCCKHIVVCAPGIMVPGDYGSFSVIEASPSDLQMRMLRQARRGSISYHSRSCR